MHQNSYARWSLLECIFCFALKKTFSIFVSKNAKGKSLFFALRRRPDVHHQQEGSEEIIHGGQQFFLAIFFNFLVSKLTHTHGRISHTSTFLLRQKSRRGVFWSKKGYVFSQNCLSVAFSVIKVQRVPSRSSMQQFNICNCTACFGGV